MMFLLGDLFAKIRNAITIGKINVQVQWSKVIESCVKLLKDEGYILDYTKTTENNKSFIDIKLFSGEANPIHGIKLVSKPSLRIYSNSTKLPKIWNNLGIAIISTSKGVMTAKEAKEKNVGGEVVAYVW